MKRIDNTIRRACARGARRVAALLCATAVLLTMSVGDVYAEASAPSVLPRPSADVAAPAAVETADADDPYNLLVAAGLPEDVAGQIVVIFTESASLREAYNKLRSTFAIEPKTPDNDAFVRRVLDDYYYYCSTIEA